MARTSPHTPALLALQPLSALACGLHAPAAASRVQLRASAAVLALCDGLAPDWGTITNLTDLAVDNIWPWGGGYFEAGRLAALPRLRRLRLSFEVGVDAVLGVGHDLAVRGLEGLVMLKDLELQCAGKDTTLIFEAPAHPLASLIVATEGPLVMQAPGTAAATARNRSMVQRHSHADDSPPASPSSGSSQASSVDMLHDTLLLAAGGDTVGLTTRHSARPPPMCSIGGVCGGSWLRACLGTALLRALRHACPWCSC